MTLRMGDSSDVAGIIHEHFHGNRDKLRGVEIGVFRGETSATLLRTFPQLHLVMVDPWETYESTHPYRESGDGCSRQTADQQANNMAAAMVATNLAATRRTILPMTSERAAAYMATYVAVDPKTATLAAGDGEQPFDGRFDFVFVDGDHTYGAVKRDIELWWPLVNAGGLLCGHDIDHPRDLRGVWGVRRAVEEHAAACGLPFDVRGSCWWMVKS